MGTPFTAAATATGTAARGLSPGGVTPVAAAMTVRVGDRRATGRISAPDRVADEATAAGELCDMRSGIRTDSEDGKAGDDEKLEGGSRGSRASAPAVTVARVSRSRSCCQAPADCR